MSYKEEKGSAELKDELIKKREEEIRGYHEELTQFLKERNIDLGASLTVTESGNQFNIFIIDRQ